MLTCLLKVILFSELLYVIHCKHIAKGTPKTNEDVYVFCDRHSPLANKSANDHKNVCKVECYTKLNSPGFCQTKAIPCKTLDVTSEKVKCKQGSGQTSDFGPVCCPFKSESNANAIEDNRHYECGKRPNIARIVGGM